MFGYVRAYAPEMKLCEYEYYRAAYCGLCRANGKCTGCASRFMLNYDFAFIALVRLALAGEEVGFRRKRCMVHPTKKRLEMIPGETLNYCAYAAALLNYHKFRDDLADERGGKRLRARFMLIFLRGMRKRAMRALPGLDEVISREIDELSALEKEKCPSVDRTAEVFGRICAEIFSYKLEKNVTVARQIGMHIGKWIYISDALDDYAEDLKNQSYNPFCVLWRDGMTETDVEGVRTALTRELMDAELGFDLLDYNDKRLRGAIENIIYCGMPQRAKTLGKDKKEKNKDE